MLPPLRVAVQKGQETMSSWEVANRLDKLERAQESHIRVMRLNAGRSLAFERKIGDKAVALEEEVAHLKLVLAAAVQLLIAKGNFSGEELAKQAQEILRTFGQKDGKFVAVLQEDGQVVPAPPPPPPPSLTPLEQLSRALEEPPQENTQ